ncbi:sugar-transfer associated ATP-grasp domain-containing protein [Thalassovita sp.]|uniref:sugar-transfer associated ATP-grasp domain-containing protein n=1 Tax=Thalassovita sp. TaxID=1979401 RepID=UPI0029DE670C|nr:sugar-transfer associated ATP-grasp domain-containing protein [Thalassovita sp.]
MTGIHPYPLGHSRAFFHGFRPWTVSLFCEPGVKDLSRYLSFLERRRICNNTNREIVSLTNNKLFFPQSLGPWAYLVPENVAYMKNGQCFDVRSGSFDRVSPERLLATESGRFVIKPIGGKCSRGVHFITVTDGVPFQQDKPLTGQELAALADPSGSIVCRYIEQHRDISRIFPEAVMTIRLHTYHDDATGRGRILCGFARMGTAASAPFESITRGGLVVSLDIETGTLGQGLRFGAQTFRRKPPRHFTDTHPDTGERINGFPLPNWQQMIDTMQQLTDALPLFEFIGWDIVLTSDSFSILEANTRPCTDTIQYFQPLLDDRPFRDFLIRRGFLRR